MTESPVSTHLAEAKVFYERGIALHDNGQHAAALAAFENAIAIAGSYLDAHAGRADALVGLGKLAEALAVYDRYLAARPNDVRVLHNRAVVLLRSGNYEEARGAFAHVLVLQPFPESQSALAEALLVQGKFEAGWEAYELRWETSALKSVRRTYAIPQWDGKADISGTTVLLHTEQGFGDTIQFCRYAHLFARRNARVVLVVQPELKSFVSTLSGISDVLAIGAPVLPQCDYHIPLMSLPRAFSTAIDTIPTSTPYLYADPVRIAHWRSRLSPTASMHVGVAWAGDAKHRNDRARSIPLGLFADLFDVPGVEFVSLQTVIRDGDRVAMAGIVNLQDWGSEFRDFADTAAAVSALDLIITVDTAVAHVAGALGKSVWVLLPYAPDWRWLLNRNDSPWYPTMYLFRQPTLGHWPAVIAEVVEELVKLQAE